MLNRLEYSTCRLICFLLVAVSSQLGLLPWAVHAEDSDADERPENYIDLRSGTVTIEDITTEGDLPVAGYEPSPGNGAFIQSPSGIFRLQIGAFIQVRWSANWRTTPAPERDEGTGEDFSRGWSLNRTRVQLEGKYTNRAAYQLQFAVSDSFDPEVFAAWMQRSFGGQWSLRIGKQFIPLSREDWMSPYDLLTAEFSPNNKTFAIGPSLGASLFHGTKKTRGWFSLHNGAVGGRETFPSPETDAAVTVRGEWMFRGKDWLIWNDMVGRRGRARGMMLGLSGLYQSKQTNISNENSALTQANLDFSINGSGYQAVLAGSGTWTDPINGAPFWTYGLLTQAGYFVARPIQLYAQYNVLSPGDLEGDWETFHSVTLGCSYFPYLWTNRWKFTAEAGFLFSALNKTIVEPSGSLGWLPSDEAGQAYLKLQVMFGF